LVDITKELSSKNCHPENCHPERSRVIREADAVAQSKDPCSTFLSLAAKHRLLARKNDSAKKQRHRRAKSKTCLGSLARAVGIVATSRTAGDC